MEYRGGGGEKPRSEGATTLTLSPLPSWTYVEGFTKSGAGKGSQECQEFIILQARWLPRRQLQ